MENLGNVIDKSVLRLDYDKLKGDHKISSPQVGLSFCTVSLTISL